MPEGSCTKSVRKGPWLGSLSELALDKVISMIHHDKYYIIEMLKREHYVQTTLRSTNILKTFYEMKIVQSCTESLVHLKSFMPIRGVSFGTDQPPDAIRQLIRRWLTDEEADNIFSRFQEACIPNRQVLWSGMLREQAQQWADTHGFQTLTTALGPLLHHGDRKCPCGQSSAKYIHGASIIFAWFISHGDLVTVLSHPPPLHFHPSGQTFYQLYEEPIITGTMGNRPVGRIDTAHPAIKTAIDFIYQLWPYDNSSLWTKTFGVSNTELGWRKTRILKPSTQVNTHGVQDRETQV
jgi:hypothetical protein